MKHCDIMNREGTFQKCTNCKENINCCQSFDKINAPTLCENEVKVISKRYSDVVEKICDDLYTIKIVNNKCVFYKNNKCQIYDIRHLDCKLYPFDIIKIENKYYLILYKLNCNNINDFINDLEDINSIVEKIKPWIANFTNPVNFTKMKNKEYTIIKEIKMSN